MAAPAPGQITAAIAALNSEAATWRGAATTVREAQGAVRRLTLDESTLSWASRTTGLLETYESLQRKAARMLGAAAGTFDVLADSLGAAADGYQKDENDAVHRTRDVW